VVVHHLATAVALELSKAQAVARTERRLVGDFLDALLEGELSATETRRRLRFLGLGASPAIAVLVARGEEPQPSEAAVEALRLLVQDRLSRRPGPYVCSIQDASVVALFEAAGPAEARTVAEAVAEAVLARRLGGRFGLGMPETDPRGLRRAYQEARFALEAADPVAGDRRARVATVDDLGSHRLLLARQEDAALEAISRSLLGPLADYDQRQHGDLVASLRAFLEHNGNWEAAARALGVHRHTLRYRVRRVAELTGRDLDAAADRVEFWLALQAADVVQGRAGRSGRSGS
jgi:purine catabolism regulator